MLSLHYPSMDCKANTKSLARWIVCLNSPTFPIVDEIVFSKGGEFKAERVFIRESAT